MDEPADEPAYGTAEMVRQSAAECLELAALFSSAAAERLRENDLPGYRCAMRCGAAATKCARELAILLGDDAALGPASVRPRSPDPDATGRPAADRARSVGGASKA